MLILSFTAIDESQPDNWRSVFQSAKAVLVTSLEIFEGYLKVCMRWVSQKLTVKQKTERKAIYSKLLARFEAVGETFLSQTVTTTDETWVHHFEMGTKR
jgi:hypothetical protein